MDFLYHLPYSDLTLKGWKWTVIEIKYEITLHLSITVIGRGPLSKMQTDAASLKTNYVNNKASYSLSLKWHENKIFYIDKWVIVTSMLLIFYIGSFFLSSDIRNKWHFIPKTRALLCIAIHKTETQLFLPFQGIKNIFINGLSPMVYKLFF